MNVSSRFVLASGLRCHYLEAGRGPPLVLLHGTAIDSARLSYGPTLPRLAERHRVLALDWPGYGESERPRDDLTVAASVSLLEAFLDAVGLERVHVAGFSMGGAAALGLALGAPGRVATLTMIGGYGLDASVSVPLLPYLAVRAPALAAGVAWGLRRSRRLTTLVLTHLVFRNPELVTEALAADVHEQLQAPAAERNFVAWLRGEMRPLGLATSYAHRLGDVTVPTLLLHGGNDRVTSWRKSVRAGLAIAGSRVVVVPDCGHWVPREASQVWLREVLDFTGGS